MKTAHLFRLALVSLPFAVLLPLQADEQRRQDSQRTGGAVSNPNDAGKLDLNTADFKALEAVPVIGSDGARAIVAARPFATINDLDRLKDFSAERLEQIRAKVMVAAPQVANARSGAFPRADPSGREQTQTQRDAEKRKVDVNTADLKTLEAIPAIGPDVARAIVAARPFASLDELNRVKGLSAERLEHIRNELTVSPPVTPHKQNPANR
jgi:DNA uptake protein ComE-like DNA-binding protein